MKIMITGGYDEKAADTDEGRASSSSPNAWRSRSFFRSTSCDVAT